jgi:hypothetical protein
VEWGLNYFWEILSNNLVEPRMDTNEREWGGGSLTTEYTEYTEREGIGSFLTGLT